MNANASVMINELSNQLDRLREDLVELVDRELELELQQSQVKLAKGELVAKIKETTVSLNQAIRQHNHEIELADLVLKHQSQLKALTLKEVSPVADPIQQNVEAQRKKRSSNGKK